MVLGRLIPLSLEQDIFACSPIYNQTVIPLMFEFRGPVPQHIVQMAVDHLTACYDTLRISHIARNDDDTYQVLEGSRGRPLCHGELREGLVSLGDSDLVFDRPSITGPLSRFTLCTSPDDDINYLVIELHHVLIDGFGCGLLERQLAARCEMLLSNESLPDPTMTSSDFASHVYHQREYGEALSVEQRRYWTASLSGYEPLPLLRARFDGDRALCEEAFELPRSAISTVRALASSAGVWPSAALYAVLALVLARTYGVRSFSVKTIWGGRESKARRALLALMARFVLIHVDVRDDDSVISCSKRIHNALLEAIGQSRPPYSCLRMLQELEAAGSEGASNCYRRIILGEDDRQEGVDLYVQYIHSETRDEARSLSSTVAMQRVSLGWQAVQPEDTIGQPMIGLNFVETPETVKVSLLYRSNIVGASTAKELFAALYEGYTSLAP